MSDIPSPPVCVVAGVGPGNGAALVRRFLDAGYVVAMLARSQTTMAGLAAHNPRARSYVVDLAHPDAIKSTLEKVEADLGPVDVLVYNAGNARWGAALEVPETDFEMAWRVNTLGAYAAARAVLPNMITRGAGRIVFIGATASLRGGPRSAAFAPAKAAQRSLAQSLAKSYGPSGVHVALVIVDGVIDEPGSRAAHAKEADDFFIRPEEVAETALYLANQPRTAWTFELDIRPFGEKW